MPIFRHGGQSPPLKPLIKLINLKNFYNLLIINNLTLFIGQSISRLKISEEIINFNISVVRDEVLKAVCLILG